MSRVTKKDLEILSKSAKITINENEYSDVISNINDVLSYVHILDNINEKNMGHLKEYPSTQTVNHFREDSAPKTNNSDAILKCCPEVENRHIVVPSIIKK